MILAFKGIIPPKEWYHQPELYNVNGDRVKNLLIKAGKEVPDCWLTQDEKDLIYNKPTIEPEFQKNKDRMTIAMWFASKGKVPP